MIKLAIISDDPGRGGAYKVATDIASGLNSSSYNVKWFFLCDRDMYSPPGIYLGCPPININYSLKSYLRLAYFSKIYERHFTPLSCSLQEFGPDIVHFHTHPIFLSLVRGLTRYAINAKYLFTDHLQRIRHNDPIWRRFLMAQVYQKLFALVRVVFISKYAFQTALKLGFADRQKDFLIENTVDTNRFLPAAKSSNEGVRVVYLARIHPVKGHHLLLDTWKKLPARETLSLHLYGNERDGGMIRKRIEAEEFSNPVIYEGVTSSPEHVLQNAQIGVFPSYREGLPLALLEMMACGLPVVASDIPEIKSVITNGKDGLLFESGNSIDFLEKLLFLIDNWDKQKALGEKARGTIEDSYNTSMSSKYSMYYQNIVHA